MPESLDQFFSNSDWVQWAYPVAAFAILFLIFITLQKLMWKRMILLAQRTNAGWDDDLIVALNAPLKLLATVLAFTTSLQLAPQILRTHPVIKFGSKMTLVLIGVWIVDRTVSTLIRSDLLPRSVSSNSRVLILSIARLLFLITAVLVVLDTLGISVTPILASLGVGSVAVALALQDTLSNFFSGIYLLMDRPVRIGDFVRLEDGTEGYVRKVGWRSTHIETPSSNLVVVPNSKVASSQLTNYDLPEVDNFVSVPVGVAYGSDLNKVEKVTIEVAKSLQESTQGAVRGHVPIVRYNSLADSSINFSVIFKVHHYTDFALLRHEFIKAIHKRFETEGIDIPFPQRVVHLRQP